MFQCDSLIYKPIFRGNFGLEMMVPVWELVNKKEFVSAWKKENPWTFKNQAWLVNVLKQAEEVGLKTMGEIGSMM